MELKRRAFREILREDLPPQDRVRLMALLARAHGKSKVTRDDIPVILERLVGEKRDEKLKAVLRAVIGPDFLLDYVRKDYEVEREFEARQSLRVLARALRISGDLLRGLADRRRLNGKPFSVLTSAGVGLWGLIEVTVPRSFASILVRYWMWLLLLAAGILYAAGVFRDDKTLRDTGLGTIGVLAAIGLLVVLVQTLLERRKAWIGWSIYAAVVLGGLFAVFGFLGDTPIPLAHPFGGTLALEGRALALAGFGLLLFAFLKEPSTRGERQRYDWVRWALYGFALALSAFGWAALQRDQGVRLFQKGEQIAASGAWIVVIVALFAMAFPLLYPLRQLYDKALAWLSSRERSRGTRRRQPPPRDRDAA